MSGRQSLGECVMRSDIFSLELYREALSKAQRLGYRFPTVTAFHTDRSAFPLALLLRHDIDTSPLDALAMAKLEHEMGVNASYYLLMHSPLYNPLAAPFYDAVRDISAMGFEIGVHYEVDFYDSRNQDPLEGVLREVKQLELLLGKTITSVSQHKPASSQYLTELQQFYIDAYHPSLIYQMKYISDSGFKWRNETLIEVIGKDPLIHALIHPTTWRYAELDMEGTYQRSAAIIQRMISQELEQRSRSTNAYLAKREELDRERESRYLVT